MFELIFLLNGPLCPFSRKSWKPVKIHDCFSCLLMRKFLDVTLSIFSLFPSDCLTNNMRQSTNKILNILQLLEKETVLTWESENLFLKFFWIHVKCHLDLDIESWRFVYQTFRNTEIFLDPLFHLTLNQKKNS